MNDNERAPKQPGRRRLLRILTGSGVAAATVYSLPGSWTRPLVEAVILPAQAQLSGGPTVHSASSSITIVEMQRWLDGPLRPLRQLAEVRQAPGKSIHDYFYTPGPAPTRSLLDFFISPVEAGLTASTNVTLFLDIGDILQVVIDLTLNYTCRDFTLTEDLAPRSAGLQFCWEGPITGSTTILSGDAGNCASVVNGNVPARIVSRDDAAGTVTVEVLGQQYVLTRGGARKVCVPCQDQFEDLSSNISSTCSEDAGVVLYDFLLPYIEDYFL